VPTWWIGWQGFVGQRPDFIEGDVRDAATLDEVFDRHPITAVMHFAGLKAVGESVTKPLEYYDNNVHGSVQLLAAMRRAEVGTFVFSSSATVYSDREGYIFREDSPRAATNPYGRSKLMVEDILADLHLAEPGWRIARLRYFNPVGAHESGIIGEDPQGVPNNLMPFVAQVASGRREHLNVWGDDYPTPDGTGVRDYIHVVDLADGHVAALDYLMREGGLLTVNLGAGRGIPCWKWSGHSRWRVGGRSRTVWPRVVRAISRSSGPIPRWRSACWDGKRTAGLDLMCADAWRWQQWSEANLRR
jgi:UDP-glucose 4-epimerase